MKNFKFYFITLCILVIASCNYQDNKKLINNDSLCYDTLLYESESNYEIYTTSGSEKHGVMKLYNKSHGLNEERLYLHNKLLIVEQFGGDSIEVGYTYYYNQSDTMYPIGSIIFDRLSFQKKDIMCSYFGVEAPDTIEYKKPYKIKIKGNLGVKNNFKISLTIGEIDSAYNLINKKATYVSEGRELDFEILDYEMGINLITGILTYYENDRDITKEYRISKINVPLVFYKQFVAIPPSD